MLTSSWNTIGIQEEKEIQSSFSLEIKNQNK